MNWLAHVFLSEPSVEFRLGNLLADIVKGSAREGMDENFLRGIQRHQAIDSFTDAHPVVKRSRARVASVQRRFSGIVVDVFYDHLLAESWNRYSAVPLPTFTAAFYADIQAAHIALPQEAQATVERMTRRDMLASYTQIEAVQHALRRISMHLAARWSRSFELEAAVVDLQTHHDAFAADFAEFFPQLQAHVEKLRDASRGDA